MTPTSALQDEITALREQLAQARQALEDFSHSVSHDLRAPLRHVRSYIRIAQEDLEDAAPPEVLAHLQTASDAATQMGHMLDALLQLSRLGQQALEPAELDVHHLVGAARQSVEAARQAQGDNMDGGAAPAPAVHWDIAPDFPALRGDPTLVSQALQHLLDNALKFTCHAARPRIAVGWRMHGAGWCELFVRDNGVGFEQRFADRLFQVFQRLHSQREFEGLGRGLAHARLAVERHGGRIRARGDLAPGCEVAFTLPLADAVVA